MIEPNQDQETPAAVTPPTESPQSKRPNHRRALSALGVFIVLVALVVVYILLPNKPTWLNACTLLRRVQSHDLFYKTPPTLVIAETSPKAIVTVQSAEQPTITPAPTLSMATATLPITITPAPTSQPPQANLTPSVSPGQYEPQEGSPFYISARPFQGNEQGCNWVGIAGQAFDAQDSPRNNLMVVVAGKLGEKELSLNTTTGSALLYGPAGYEVSLSLKPQDSQDTLTVQLFNEMGRPLSAQVPFATYATCEKNLAIVNFVETK
jgi:hypothetical protein